MRWPFKKRFEKAKFKKQVEKAFEEDRDFLAYQTKSGFKVQAPGCDLEEAPPRPARYEDAYAREMLKPMLGLIFVLPLLAYLYMSKEVDRLQDQIQVLYSQINNR